MVVVTLGHCTCKLAPCELESTAWNRGDGSFVYDADPPYEYPCCLDFYLATELIEDLSGKR